MHIKEIIALQKERLKNQLNKEELAYGEIIFLNGQCQILSQSSLCYEFIVNDESNDKSIEYRLDIAEDGMIFPKANSEGTEWDRNAYACLLQVEKEIHLLDPREHEEHKKYTRKGMIRRVLLERLQKAEKARYHVQWADNIYGDHVLTNEKGVKYKIFLRDFENETGYSNSMDAMLNKLGTTKHIMYAFRILKENKTLFHKLSKIYPFIEVFCDPLNDNKISWYYPHPLQIEDVLSQLPNVRQIDIPVDLSPLQADYHISYAKGLAQIVRKKFLTPFDLQRMQLLLANMRMVCDSTWLIDDETNESPKLDELKYILLEKLDLKNREAKIIIFSEWIKVHKLVGRLLLENNIGFVELNGQIPVKIRGELIRKFEENPLCKVFLSTESGGSGLNLQVADTLINFELPWNPAKKNQRIGRIDRIGQRSNHLTIYNFITRNSIEQRIASGLLVKQNLFDGVLGDNSNTNFVDFSSKGRSQFIQQLEDFITEAERWEKEDAVLSEECQQLEKIATGEAAGLSPLVSVESLEEEEDENPSAGLDLSADTAEQQDRSPEEKTEKETQQTTKAEEIETVMNSGMQFLAGLFKMSTRKEMGIENQKIEVNQETGEVVMRFKLPI